MKRRHLIIHDELTLAQLQTLETNQELIPGKIYLATDTDELYRPKTNDELGFGFTMAGGGATTGPQGPQGATGVHGANTIIFDPTGYFISGGKIITDIIGDTDQIDWYDLLLDYLDNGYTAIFQASTIIDTAVYGAWIITAGNKTIDGEYELTIDTTIYDGGVFAATDQSVASWVINGKSGGALTISNLGDVSTNQTINGNTHRYYRMTLKDNIELTLTDGSTNFLSLTIEINQDTTGDHSITDWNGNIWWPGGVIQAATPSKYRSIYKLEWNGIEWVITQALIQPTP